MTHKMSTEEDSFAHDSVVAFLEESNRSYAIDKFKSRELFTYSVPIEDYTHLIRVEIFIKPYSDKFAFYALAPFEIHSSHYADVFEIFAMTYDSNTPIRSELNPKDGFIRSGMTCFLIEDLVSSERLTQLEQQSVGMIRGMIPWIESLRLEKE